MPQSSQQHGRTVLQERWDWRQTKDVLVSRLGFQVGLKSQHDQVIWFLSVLSYHIRKLRVAPQDRYRVPSLWDYHHKMPMSTLETTLRETTHRFTNKQTGYQQWNIKKPPFSTPWSSVLSPLWHYLPSLRTPDFVSRHNPHWPDWLHVFKSTEGARIHTTGGGCISGTGCLFSFSKSFGVGGAVRQCEWLDFPSNKPPDQTFSVLRKKRFNHGGKSTYQIPS